VVSEGCKKKTVRGKSQNTTDKETKIRREGYGKVTGGSSGEKKNSIEKVGGDLTVNHSGNHTRFRVSYKYSEPPENDGIVQ
jgi:hypothetical protein